MDLLAILNPKNIPDRQDLHSRIAARAVIEDGKGHIALIVVTKFNYCKLPGGGIEEGENIEAGLKRECMEETGFDITIGDEIGYIIEYRTETFKQISYCFLAKAVAKKSEPSFTDLEASRGFTLQWVSLDEAIRLLATSDCTDENGKFIETRDLIFLRKAKEVQR